MSRRATTFTIGLLASSAAAAGLAAPASAAPAPAQAAPAQVAATQVAAAQVAAERVRVVARGLDNPRGLDVAPDGSVWVVEAGRGGNGPTVTSPTGPVRYGATGAVTRVTAGGQRRVLTGLPSLAPATGNEAVGPSDISFDRSGRADLSIGLGADPAVRRLLPANGRRLATLQRVDWRTRRTTQSADLGAYEASADPDGAGADTNPNSLVRVGRSVYVADAGGNALLRFRGGRVTTRAVFGPRPAPAGSPVPSYSAVPTSVTRDLRGSLLVGQLTGFPFPVGAADVYRARFGRPARVFASGFTTISDVAASYDGTLYVLQLTTNGLAAQPPAGPGPGRLIRITPDGKRTELAAGQLVFPTGITLGEGRDRAVYVSVRGAEAGQGQVLRVPLPRR